MVGEPATTSPLSRLLLFIYLYTYQSQTIIKTHLPTHIQRQLQEQHLCQGGETTYYNDAP